MSRRRGNLRQTVDGDRPYWTAPRLLLRFFVYFVLAAATIATTRFRGGVSLVWLANAALIAVLMTTPRREWRAPIAVSFLSGALATATLGLGALAAVPMAIVNVAEAWFGVRLIGWFRGKARRTPFTDLRNFVLGPAIVSPATFGLAGAAIATYFGASSYQDNYVAWLAGHGLGVVTFTPLAMYLVSTPLRAMRSADRSELAYQAMLVALMVAVCLPVFTQTRFPLLFLTLLPLILVTFEGGRPAAALGIVALTLIAGAFTLAGYGPIALIDAPVSSRVQFLQFFLAATVLTILPISTALADKRDTLRRLRESEARYRLLADQSTDIVLTLTADGVIEYASPSIHQLGGYRPAELIGTSALALVEAEFAKPVIESHRAALEDPSRTFIVEYQARTAQGQLRWFETHSRAVVDEDGTIGGVTAAVRDVTHRKAREQRLADAALTDPLTGLANRRAFEAALEERLGRDGSGGCVALFDLDRFKGINDRFGHAGGDAVLRCFASLARSTVRDNDMVARLGGEEFAVLLPGAGLEQARLVCNRLREALSAATIRNGSQVIRATVSAGVAALPTDGTAADVMDAVDRALYRAKRDGRDQVALAA